MSRIYVSALDIPDNLPYPCRCAPERVDSVRLTINGERRTIHLCAYGWETRHSWGHAAWCPELGTTEKYRYYNRTWECHRFDSVLKGLLEKCKMLDKKHAAKVRREERIRRAKRKAEIEAAKKMAVA